MSTKGLQTKDKIIHATLHLITEEGDINNLSVRRIAKIAGVNFSTINYYFQTKDNLIRKSIEIAVNKVISRWIDLNKSLDMEPLKKLRLLMKNTGDYYAKHPNVMKIALMNTFIQEQEYGNLQYFIDAALIPLLCEICPEKSRIDIQMTIEIVFFSFPNAFLHFMFHPDKSSLNFFIKEEREAYLDKFVDVLIFTLQS
jgi:TetR/AcrR family transcriptional regulator, regulator of cefoperazone and chloramphenicol sensitivity